MSEQQQTVARKDVLRLLRLPECADDDDDGGCVLMTVAVVVVVATKDLFDFNPLVVVSTENYILGYASIEEL